MTYRDTPSQEPPAPAGVPDHLLPVTSNQPPEFRMELEEGMASPWQEDFKVRTWERYAQFAIHDFVERILYPLRRGTEISLRGAGTSK